MAVAAQKQVASPEGREAPILKPSALVWNHEGFCWRTAMIRLPEGMLIQDLMDVPTCFKGIQSQPQTRLRRYDRITCVSHAGDWMVKDVVVTAADQTQVFLALRPTDKITLPATLPGEIPPEVW